MEKKEFDLAQGKLGTQMVLSSGQPGTGVSAGSLFGHKEDHKGAVVLDYARMIPAGRVNVAAVPSQLFMSILKKAQKGE